MVKKKITPVHTLKELYLLSPMRLRLLLIPMVLFLSIFIYNLFFWNKIFPGIYLSGIYVGGKSPAEAEAILMEKLIPQKEIRLNIPGQTFNIPIEELNIAINYSESAESAYGYYRNGNLIISLLQRLRAPVKTVNLGLDISLNEEFLDNTLGIVAEETSQDPVYPSVELVGAEVLVQRGSPGSVLDKERLKAKIKENLRFGKKEAISLSIERVDPTINTLEADKLESRAQNLIGKRIVLTSPQEVFEWKDDKVFEFLKPEGSYKKDAIAKGVSEIATELNREPQNPIFIFLPAGEAGGEGRVKEFAPAQDGISVQQENLYDEVVETLTSLEESDKIAVSLEIPLETLPPKIKTADVNNLGIKELIGKGSSNYRGSIANRVFNIGHASSKFSGVLVAPGQTFSFNEVLGDVSSLTGYKQAFVIKDGKTILGDGGGVCQVSSTFFRAALNAGLPVIDRRAHSYRVSYYEQGFPPGLDATVYAPTTDLKVLNDTPGHILIQPIFDPKAATLTFELYGTSDGRVAKTTKPIVTGVTPPPDDLYVDDPTLPAGQIKQIDFKAWGAKVTFNYTVERRGELIYEKTFVSNFRPWQAVFLRGTGPS